ncbi:serine protein kinase RIO [Candidatus Woesearchaeota archaeon]|nr:serine protein kinase RIO [Candidatus Woesearchaeota archaeon]
MVKKTKEEWKIYKNVFDRFTVKTIFKLITQGYFEGLTSPYKIGKESNIYLAKKQKEKVIVKIYRLESCNFNKMYDYIKTDPRYMKLKKQRRKVIFSWVQREYRNLLKAREKINVPTPHAFSNNIIVMEMIGKYEPAPQLKDVIPENIEEFFEKTVGSVKKLLELGLVHGDLSEFNILNYMDLPFFIDFSQTTEKKDPRAKELLERDCKNLARFFKKSGIKTKKEEILKKILE